METATQPTDRGFTRFLRSTASFSSLGSVSSSTSTATGSGAKRNRRTMRALVTSRTPGSQTQQNHVCADCLCEDPMWVVFPWGAFICTVCSGVHRSLGVHVSFVRSIELDNFTTEEVETVQSRGNARVNEELEYYVPVDYCRPHPHEPDAEARERFIRAKYTRQFDINHAPIDDYGRRIRNPPRVQDSPVSPPVSPPKNMIRKGMVEYSGVLRVEVKGANYLSPRDLTMLADPYLVLETGMQRVRSKTVRRSLSPLWNEMLMLCWAPGQTVKFSVYDEDVLTKDVFMGQTVLDITDLPEHPTPLRLYLRPKSEEDPELWRVSRNSVELYDTPRAGCWRSFFMGYLGRSVTGYVDVEMLFVKIDH